MDFNIKDFENHKNFFLVGIGGAGMSAIAIVLNGMGFSVKGSDIKESRYVNILRNCGIKVFIGHCEKNIDDSDALIYSAAISSDNVEMKAARRKKIHTFTRSDALAWILSKGKGIAIAGTHGKTTTTSMISMVLSHLDMDPTIIIGGELNELGTNASFGMGKYVVAEACESDGSFMKYSPFISVVTNIEEDHMDYYKNYENLRQSFIKFINNTEKDGFLIVNGDEVTDEKLSGVKNMEILRFGISNSNDIYAENIVLDDFKSNFLLVIKNINLKMKVKLSVPGIHNIKNSLAALSVAFKLNLDIGRSIRILENYVGVKRRFEKRGISRGATIIDDYAHHPSEIKAVLDAALNIRKNRIITVFQPHRYSRIKALYEKFDNCFDKTDVLVLTDIYSSGENPIPGITSKLLVDFLIKNDFKKKLAYIPKLTDVKDYVESIVNKDDMVLIMGAGDITRISDELIKNPD
ncbi:MAG: UDP-N-acetylmuramate--L-alanine ligase [Cyanobacteria bacterium]|nr:UDP-N-acetylmuramate--L-alanine ligase [Cyanobacteriota bacterium]